MDILDKNELLGLATVIEKGYMIEMFGLLYLDIFIFNLPNYFNVSNYSMTVFK
jgi:hypothetical protein